MLIWNGEAFKKFVNAKAADRIEAATIYVQNEVKAAISEPSNKGQTPSLPGEPPHKDTGILRGSISRETDRQELKGRVGTNLAYGKFLELGTFRLAPRPFLRSTLARVLPMVQKILRGG